MNNLKCNSSDTNPKTSLFFEKGKHLDDLNLLHIFLSEKIFSNNCDCFINLQPVRGHFHNNKKQMCDQNVEAILGRVKTLKKTTPRKFEKLIVAFHLLLTSRSTAFVDIAFILQKKCWDNIIGLDKKLPTKFAKYFVCQPAEINRTIKYLKKLRNSYVHDSKTKYNVYLDSFNEGKLKLNLNEIDFFKSHIKPNTFDKFKIDSLWAWDYLISLYFLNEFKILNINNSPSIQINEFMNLLGYINNLKARHTINVNIIR